MAEEKNKFYVTTPIYYVTAKPHLGSLYSTLLADVAARWHILQGKKTFFLTGTDEHGQKIAQAAQAAGKDPKAFVDSFIDTYKNVWAAYNLDYTHFIRTTDPEHIHAVQEWIRKLKKQGDIYKSFYSGWYCVPCETFVTEKEKHTEAQGPLCPTCGRQTNFVSEECYFFKLSAYQDKLLEFYARNPNFITPKERLHEVLSFVQAGLNDLSISRTTVKWGIPFPDDPDHVVYVWADALNNYITAIGYGQETKQKEFDFWWPADLQVLGKDIVRFHAVYWPAFLMATGLEMPKKLLVHGWIKIGEQKMSKSLGNVVDPEVLYHDYGADPIRYYLMRHIAINQDSSFSIEDLEHRISADLANDLGNLLNRVVTLAHKYTMYEVPTKTIWSEQAVALRGNCWTMIDEYSTAMNEYLFHHALASVWKFIHQVNSYFHTNEPWKLAQSDPERFKEIISASCNSLRTIAVLLWPIMPTKMEELLKTIGSESSWHGNVIDALKINRWDHHFVLHLAKNLFEKPEKKVPMEETKVTEKVVNTIPEISIEDVTKLHIVIGTIEECDIVPQSDKLYRMKVNCGEYGVRTILAGIRATFSPSDLINKQAPFIVNLKPRMMMGIESQGMMLVAPHDEKQVLLTVERPVKNGTRLR